MKNQRGFTLIELIMVIVILGILAATALPKFASLQADAREASIAAAGGAMRSAMAIVHAASLIAGSESNPTDTITLEGSTINIVYGYPALADIDEAAGITSNDYDIAAGVISIPGRATCSVTYAIATSTTAASVAAPDLTGC